MWGLQQQKLRNNIPQLDFVSSFRAAPQLASLKHVVQLSGISPTDSTLLHKFLLFLLLQPDIIKAQLFIIELLTFAFPA